VLGQRLEVRQGQGLVITPQLQQAIKLLQLSNMELEAYVEAELERNPLLQRDEPEAVEGDAPAEHRLLEVVATFGDTVLDVTHLRAGRFTIGQSIEPSGDLLDQTLVAHGSEGLAVNAQFEHVRKAHQRPLAFQERQRLLDELRGGSGHRVHDASCCQQVTALWTLMPALSMGQVLEVLSAQAQGRGATRLAAGAGCDEP
jgi:DNA-directed RNA polymerase specialized sigma54-like protein